MHKKQKLAYINQYPPIKYIKVSMRQLYQCSTILEKNILIVLHIHGYRSIFLLFCDHQDTESELCEIEMSISQPILTHKNTSKALLDTNIQTIQDGRKILW